MYEKSQIQVVYFSTAIFMGGDCGRTVLSELIKKKKNGGFPSVSEKL